MLKKIIFIACLAVAAVTLTKTFAGKPWPHHRAPVLEPLPDSAIAHMSAAIQIATISPEDTSRIDSLHFNQFRVFLEQSYPFINRMLGRTIIKDYSYVYEWKGKD